MSESNSDIRPPGVIFRLPVRGRGIGNQLFFYACSYGLARKNSIPLYIYCNQNDCRDGAVISDRRFSPINRDFALDKFEIPLTNMFSENSPSLIAKIRQVNDQAILEESYEMNEETFLEHQFGYYCQSPEFWFDYQTEIRSMFKLKLDSIRSERLIATTKSIVESESVAVHIRRGDFLFGNTPHPPFSFQRRAIRKLARSLASLKNKRPTFFIFSDDYTFTKKKLSDMRMDYDLVFIADVVNGSTSLEDFYLMTQCKHIIFPDSTFSWWAAWLNENPAKIVLTTTFHPEFWRRSPLRNGSDFYRRFYGMMYHPKEWHVLNPFTGGFDVV